MNTTMRPDEYYMPGPGPVQYEAVAPAPSDAHDLWHEPSLAELAERANAAAQSRFAEQQPTSENWRGGQSQLGGTVLSATSAEYDLTPGWQPEYDPTTDVKLLRDYTKQMVDWRTLQLTDSSSERR